MVTQMEHKFVNNTLTRDLHMRVFSKKFRESRQNGMFLGGFNVEKTKRKLIFPLPLLVVVLHHLLVCFEPVVRMSEDSSLVRCFYGIAKRNMSWTD